MDSLRSSLCRWFCTLVLVALTLPVVAQTLEIINLRYRTADYVIPQIQPFLAPGAALSGVGENLFVRTSAQNLAQLRELIRSIDTPVRRLLISLRSDGESSNADTDAGLQGGVSINNGKVSAGGTATMYSSSRHQRNDLSTQMQTIDGGRAVLHVGQSFLLPLRQVVFGPGGVIVSDTLVQRQVDSGFVALPRLAGNSVTVEISPQLESFSQSAAQPLGVVESQRLYTTVSGRLGEWLVLGGGDAVESGDGRGGASYSSHSVARQRRVLLKVDLLD